MVFLFLLWVVLMILLLLCAGSSAGRGHSCLPLLHAPLPHTLQFFLVASALYVGYTHCLTTNHWSDVLVGLLHSTLVVHLTVYYISDIFKTWPHSTG